MAFGEGVRTGTAAITVGEVHHHVVRSEVVLRCPSHSPLAAFVKNLRGKGVRNNSGSLSTDLLGRDGHSFAFILHYIITGDLVYPLHEGFHRVDALLKELTFYGLVEDVIRNATQDGSARGKNKKRQQLLFTANGTAKSSTIKGGDLRIDRRDVDISRRSSLTKALSFQNISDLDDMASNLGKHSVSMNNLMLENEVKGCGDSPLQSKCRMTVSGHRFLAIVKRYLSLKSNTKIVVDNKQISTVRKSKSSTVWNPRDGGGGGGVFRPTSAQGATLVLVAEPDYVTVFGQRSELELLFPDCQVVPLRTTSSAFIDAQLVYQPDDPSVTDETSSDLECPTPRRSSTSEVLWRIYKHRIQSRGFCVTVQSHWRDKETLEDHHQWLLHKKSNTKNSTGRRSNLNLVSNGSNNVPLNAPLGRRTSVLQRLFQRSSLTVHLTSDAICE